MDKFSFRRYPDGCYAVILGSRRGPVGNSRRRALARYLRRIERTGTGLCALARSDS